ncbi:hypothetical protein Vretimale_1694 [Volvox reticuliferus]|uniref:RING-CH-type domain-containing protein n=1 Tax=Volvox reticuliferus TaxID=1737510 RepID=A0A8J4D8B9_9CHLO|nr:hypothetical protein Vretifemale_15508 [Volvox reticuliferus]GIL95737.1 hypothetical protein Vretimale_1694 [Volvox reticuliferus]
MRNPVLPGSGVAEETERLLGSRTNERVERVASYGSTAVAALPTAEEHQDGHQDSNEKRGHHCVLVIPAAVQQPASTSGRNGASGTSPRASCHARTASLDSLKSNRSSSSGSGPSSATVAPKGESGLCRICLEEDSLSNLEQPCACAGTQKYAHHECIQRWVNEKGHLRCEICDQQYRGNFSVPPPGVTGTDDAGNVLSSMFAIRVDHGGEPLGARHDRAALDFLDESDHYYQRNPLASWCFTFVIFVMFLVVLHHTMIVADGMDGSTASGDESEDYATSLTLFLFWIGTKAFLIGIPLYTIMRIAARQARREQYEAMLRTGAFEAPARRYVWRMQLRDQERGHGQLPV